jgi:hypothetical protein
MVVIGTLYGPDYAMFVSHQHPDGQVRSSAIHGLHERQLIALSSQAHFNVFSPAKTGQEWGMFTTDTDVPIAVAFPITRNFWRIPGFMRTTSRLWDTVLLARLRFKPDSSEPTSL